MLFRISAYFLFQFVKNRIIKEFFQGDPQSVAHFLDRYHRNISSPFIHIITFFLIIRNIVHMRIRKCDKKYCSFSDTKINANAYTQTRISEISNLCIGKLTALVPEDEQMKQDPGRTSAHDFVMGVVNVA